MLAVALSVAAPPVEAASMTVRLPYEGAALYAHSSPPQDCSGDPIESRGVVCFFLPPGTVSASWSVHDSSGLPVGGTYWLYDAVGALRAAGIYCVGGGLPAANGDLLIVRVEAVNGPLACVDSGAGPGVAAGGVVAVHVD